MDKIRFPEREISWKINSRKTVVHQSEKKNSKFWENLQTLR